MRSAQCSGTMRCSLMNTSCIVGVWFLGRRVHCVTSPGDIRRIWCAVLPLHCGSFSRCFPASEGSALALRSLLKALPWLQWQYVPGRGRGDEFTGQFVFREGARDQNAAGGAFSCKKQKRSRGLRVRHQYRPPGGMVPEPRKILGRRFWRYSQSPHGARTGGAERQGGGCFFIFIILFKSNSFHLYIYSFSICFIYYRRRKSSPMVLFTFCFLFSLFSDPKKPSPRVPFPLLGKKWKKASGK